MNIHRSIVLAALLGLAMTPEASAAPGRSWNLSRDMIVDWNFGPNSNPLSPASWWTFMGTTNSNPTLVCNGTQPTYAALPNYTGGAVSRWDGFFPYQEVGIYMDPNLTGHPVPGLPYLHPGNQFATAVRWKNPLGTTHNVHVLGRFTDANPNGGDGANWHVVKVSGCTATILSSGFVHSTTNLVNDTDVFYSGVSVGPNDSLYFIVDRNGDYYFDSTELDVLITSSTP